MIDRYAQMFASAADTRRGVLIPFLVVGDPSPSAFLHLVEALVASGASALELGIPFSDPVADGPAVQAAMLRARAAGVERDQAFDLIRQVREAWPDLPIGLLVYGNLVVVPSTERFYAQCAASGVDSVLCADVPVQHIEPFQEAAIAVGVQTVLVVPPNATRGDVAEIASRSQGYTYVLSRNGVTGTERGASRPSADLVRELARRGAPPAIVGFGISRPDHVRVALESGAAGTVVGSAYSRLIEESADLRTAIESVAGLTNELAQPLPPQRPI